MDSHTIPVALDAAVRSELTTLLTRRYGYLGITTVDGGPLIGPYLEAKLENHNTQRTVLLHYFPGSEKAPENLALLVKRYRHEQIELRAFLKHTGTEQATIEEIQLVHYAGSSAQKIRSCLSAMHAVLESSALRVISGQEWPDLPFDWQGLK
ncbi:MAG: hypothetical protein EOP39_15985 [Rubrivivax sp.]|nr:MAG: hypothetical protein EOP39_15985 [Rubrivivax sp.]